MRRAETQRTAAEAIVRLGGAVSYDNPELRLLFRARSQEEHAVWPHFLGEPPPPPAWTWGMLDVHYFTDVAGAKVTDRRALHYLACLPGLKFLCLMPELGEEFSDDDLAAIQDLRGLRSLIFGGGGRPQAKNEITDAGLAHLEGLSELQCLVLTYYPITDAGCKSLARLANLRELDLSATRITDNGLESIGKLTQLRKLSLDMTKITDAGLRHLKGLKNLRELSFQRTKIHDKGLRDLTPLPRLRSVKANHSKVTLGGAIVLRVLPEIRGAEVLDMSTSRCFCDLWYRPVQRALEKTSGRPAPADDNPDDEIFLGEAEDLQQISRDPKAEAVRAVGIALAPPAWAEVARLTHLRSLSLHAAGVDDAQMKNLRGLARLERLTLDDTQLTDSGLESLSCLPNLRELRLWASPGITGEGMKYLAGLHRLESLSLACTNLHGSGLAQLKGLPELGTLELIQCHFDRELVRSLAGLKHLQTLCLAGCTAEEDVMHDMECLAHIRLLVVASIDSSKSTKDPFPTEAFPNERYDIGDTVSSYN